jgi:hypothetical protein
MSRVRLYVAAMLLAAAVPLGPALALSVRDTTSDASWNPSRAVPRRFTITVQLAADEDFRNSSGTHFAEVRFARHRRLGSATSGVGHVRPMSLVQGTTNQFTYTASRSETAALEKADAVHYEFKVYYSRREYRRLKSGRPAWVHVHRTHRTPPRRLVAGCPRDQENSDMRTDKNTIVARFPGSMPWVTVPLDYRTRPLGLAQVKNGGVAFARLGSVFDTLSHAPNQEMPDSVAGRPDVLIYRNRAIRSGESRSRYRTMLRSDSIFELDGWTPKTMTLAGYGYGKVFWPTRRPKIRWSRSTGTIACYASDNQAVHEAEYHMRYRGRMRGMNTPPGAADNPRGSAIATETTYWKNKVVCADWETGNTTPPCKRVSELGPWGAVIPGVDVAFWHPRFWTLHVWLRPGNTTASNPVPTIDPPVPMDGIDLAVDGHTPFFLPDTWR